MFFPFIKDKYSNETIPGSIVYHKTDYHIKRKDHAFALSVSWNFGVGKKKNLYGRIWKTMIVIMDYSR